MDVNKAIIVGRLTRDPETRTTPSGITVATLSVATNFVYKNQDGQKTEQVEYHNVVVWRKLAEIAGQYLRKGRRVLFDGRLQSRSWDANDGTKRSRTEIIADNLIMLDSAPGGSVVNRNDDGPMAAPTENAAPPVGKPAANDEISVEDIPF